LRCRPELRSRLRLCFRRRLGFRSGLQLRVRRGLWGRFSTGYSFALRLYGLRFGSGGFDGGRVFHVFHSLYPWLYGGIRVDRWLIRKYVRGGLCGDSQLMITAEGGCQGHRGGREGHRDGHCEDAGFQEFLISAHDLWACPTVRCAQRRRTRVGTPRQTRAASSWRSLRRSSPDRPCPTLHPPSRPNPPAF
jgi:hypothetical protein